MAVKADQKYEATVKSALFSVNDKGTLGLGMNYDTSDGPIAKTWYVTENTVERLKKTLAECFGVADEQLQDQSFLDGGVNDFLRDRPCSITTEVAKDTNGNPWKDKHGNTYASVQWMNPSRLGKKATGQSLVKLAGIFGAPASAGSSQEPPPQDWNEQSEPPF